jgi:hypothetical protein
MSETVPGRVKTSTVRGVANTRYRKWEETRHRILDAAPEAFSEASFKAVTTRRISAAAVVSLPTLQYYLVARKVSTALAPKPLLSDTAATRRLLPRKQSRS